MRSGENRLLEYDLGAIDREYPGEIFDFAAQIRAYGRTHGPDHHAATQFDERDLFRYIEAAGFEEVRLDFSAWNTLAWETQEWDAWLDSSPAPGVRTNREAINESLTPDQRDRFLEHVRPLVEGKTPTDASGASAYMGGCPGINTEGGSTGPVAPAAASVARSKRDR